jgi:hypothetical protein
MPKKSRHSKAKQRANLAKPIQERHPQQLEPTTAEPRELKPATAKPRELKPATAKPQSPARISHGVQDIASRYQYVMPELKLIGILGGSMILILIILSFVLG